MGLTVEILKSANEATGNGASSQEIKGFCITEIVTLGSFNGEPVLTVKMGAPFSPSAQFPEAKIVIDRLNPSHEKRVRLIPVQQFNQGRKSQDCGSLNGPMFGGNFVYASDSRFAALNNSAPVKIFDRFECWN